MDLSVYCVGADADAVAGALGAASRRIACTTLPRDPEVVLELARHRAPSLFVLGGDAPRVVPVAHALADDPMTDAVPIVAWGVHGSSAETAHLVALGARVCDGHDAFAQACDELLDVGEGRTVRVASPAFPDEAEEVPLHGRRVLVADDDPAVAWYFVDVLRLAGCDAQEVHDGAEALDRARRFVPEVVLADIRMPALDGLRLCRALRADPILGDVPVVLLSWKADWIERASHEDVGATAFLTKHCVPDDVIARVREVLSLHVELERRFRTADPTAPVRGLLDRVLPHRLLRLACATRPDSRLSLRTTSHAYEVHLRAGAPRKVTRVASDGGVLRGDAALGSLLSVRSGRYLVAQDRSAVEPELTGTLHQLLALHVAQARGGFSRPAPVTPSVPVVVEMPEPAPPPAATTQPLAMRPVTVRAVERTAPLPVNKVVQRAPEPEPPQPAEPGGFVRFWRGALRLVGFAT
ncbi:MAG TPA: response regulator [Polyangiaceae bacterium]